MVTGAVALVIGLAKSNAFKGLGFRAFVPFKGLACSCAVQSLEATAGHSIPEVHQPELLIDAEWAAHYFTAAPEGRRDGLQNYP